MRDPIPGFSFFGIGINPAIGLTYNYYAALRLCLEANIRAPIFLGIYHNTLVRVGKPYGQLYASWGIFGVHHTGCMHGIGVSLHCRASAAKGDPGDPGKKWPRK
jgi:hypothetical protein